MVFNPDNKKKEPLFRGRMRLSKSNKTDLGDGWTTDPAFSMAFSIASENCPSGIVQVEYSVTVVDDGKELGT